MRDSRLFQKEVTRNTRFLRKEIGRNIHVHRLRKGMTLEKLSGLCGVSVARLDYLEMGKAETDLRHVVSLAMCLRVNVGDLLAV